MDLGIAKMLFSQHDLETEIMIIFTSKLALK